MSSSIQLGFGQPMDHGGGNDDAAARRRMAHDRQLPGYDPAASVV
jgi:hypothetical protein